MLISRSKRARWKRTPRFSIGSYLLDADTLLFMMIRGLKSSKSLSPLQATEHVGEQGTNLRRIDAIQDLPQARIAGNAAHTVDPPNVGITATLVKRQQRGLLQREHGEGRHENIAERDRDQTGPRILHRLDFFGGSGPTARPPTTPDAPAALANPCSTPQCPNSGTK